MNSRPGVTATMKLGIRLSQMLLAVRCGTERSEASADNMAVLSGVLRCWPLRRTVQVRLGTTPAVARDGRQVEQPSLRSRHSNS